MKWLSLFLGALFLTTFACCDDGPADGDGDGDADTCESEGATCRNDQDCCDGLSCHDEDGTGARVQGNRFSSHESAALTVNSSASATVLENKFYGNQLGVRVFDASAELRGNEFVGNRHAVTLGETDATLADNTIRGGEIGVMVTAGSSPLIRENLVENVATRGIFVANEDGNNQTQVMKAGSTPDWGPRAY